MSAGAVDAADHLGAALGALLAGALLIPLLGVTWTAALVAGVKLLSVAAGLVAPLPSRAHDSTGSGAG